MAGEFHRGRSSDAVVYNVSQPLLRLPATINRKSKADEDHPLHEVALRDLMAIRGKRELLFPAWPKPHAKNTIYHQFHDLERAAGLEPQVGIAFHGVRRRVLTELGKVSRTAAQLAGGHSSFKTTVEHYIGQEALHAAVDALPLLRKLGG